MKAKQSKNPRRLSPAQKAWITRKVKSGISQYQTAQELDISYPTVLRNSKHLPSHPRGRTGIRGQTLEMLQELVSKGYIFCNPGTDTQKYHTLKKYFPTIQKTRYQYKSMLFLEDKAQIEARAYLDQHPKKIISYMELKQITNNFGVNLSKKEKTAFISKNRVNKR